MSGFKIGIIPVTAFQQNCALIWDEGSKACAVVDPGGDGGRIVNAVAELELKVEKILLTHGHLDHVGAAAELREAFGVPVIGPDARDQFLMDAVETQAAKYGFDGMRNVTPDQYLAEGDSVTLGELRFDVLHCPGHSPGSVVFIEKARRFAVLGDVLFQGSVGRTDFPYGDAEALIDAIKTKLLPLGDDMAFLCGHGPGSSLGAERRSNAFLQG
jgi:glyoxylase-like metal-dependent hydrolase (beta-lactamase superfamily II)